jgi:hypothetical protein
VLEFFVLFKNKIVFFVFVDNRSVMSGQFAGMINERTTINVIFEDFINKFVAERESFVKRLNSLK